MFASHRLRAVTDLINNCRGLKAFYVTVLLLIYFSFGMNGLVTLNQS